MIDPRDLAAARNQMDELQPGGLFVGAKIHTDYSATPAGSPRYGRRIAPVRRARIACTRAFVGHPTAGPARYRRAGRRGEAIAGHMGGPARHLAPEAASRADRIWLEPGYSQPEADRMRWVRVRVGPERLLFGTDSTLIDPALSVGAFRAAELDLHEVELIMHRNAERLFGP